MVNFVTGMIGIAAVGAFLGIMLWWVKALPLIVIVLVVLVFLIVDFVRSVRAGNGNGAKS